MRDKKRSSVINISSSSDEELVTSLVKRRRTAEYVKLSNISSELREVKDTLEKILTVTNNMSIPIRCGFLPLVHVVMVPEAFQKKLEPML